MTDPNKSTFLVSGERLSSPLAAEQSSTAHILLTLARCDAQKFTCFFSRVRQVHAEEITRACLRHIASAEFGAVSREMTSWLARGSAYLKLLFDPEFMPLEQARRALRLMREADEQFLTKVSRALDEYREEPFIIRALALLENSEDYSAFSLRLCRLTWQPNARIRSKAVLALCRIRPNRPVIERHLESPDARVRANAVEALWHTESGKALRLLKESLTDPHHRVVVNGIMGLYYSQDEAFYGKMLELAHHAGPNFRLSLAWALGQIRDQRAFSLLRALQQDDSLPVRLKAAASLTAISTGVETPAGISLGG